MISKMKMKIHFILTFVSLFIFSEADKVSYKDFKVFKFMIKTESERDFIKNLVESNNDFTYWSGLSMSIPTSIMVSPKGLDDFIIRMGSSGIKYKKFIDNVQDLIDHQVNGGGGTEGFGWKRYHTLEEIYAWLDSLPEKYPEQVKVIVAGHTYENRQIKGAKISFKKNNPGVFIECGIHSYEWVSSATGTYLINELLTSSDPEIRRLAESYDWYIIPSFNPDGYVYTHTTDRMWSKNRFPENSTGCTGVNLNRNWDYKWMVTGATNNPCDAKYGGKKGFSEIETKSTSEYLKSVGDKLFAHISFHSFAQLLMVPYGYTNEHLDNFNETYAIGIQAAKALAQRYGTEYTVGSLSETIYPTAGSSADWVKGILKLPIVYCYELRDKGDYGMLLPPDQIIPNGQEVIDSLISIFKEAKKLGYPKQ